MRIVWLLLAACAFAAGVSDPKVRLRESERDYYLVLLQISQLQAKAVELQTQITQQYGDLAKTCAEGTTFDRQTLDCAPAPK